MAAHGDGILQMIVDTLAKDGSIPDTATLALPEGLDQLTLLGCINSLTSRDIVAYTTLERDILVLTDEGQEIAQNGSWEARLFRHVQLHPGVSPSDISKEFGDTMVKVGQGQAMKAKWIKMEDKKLYPNTEANIVDHAQVDLLALQRDGAHPDAAKVKELTKRKLIRTKTLASYSIQKGPKFTTKLEKEATEITDEMIKTASWKTQTFKKYNFNALGVSPSGGHLHPLMKVRQEYREIFFELGFTEMPTNCFVDSAFWNFDALFVPQRHAARDLQDTFYVKDPPLADLPAADVVDRVRRVHAQGGFGSIGYQVPWSEEESRKLLLRTHTTAVTGSMLYLLAQEKEFRPVKYFSIDRVFRNETLDATHLAEFHQIEGVAADRNITLGDLIGTINRFFRKLGIQKLRFKPAYNPYTEPSMEIFSWHDGLKKWVEIGNSGMFRPELLRPLGLPADVRCFGFGLSLERPTMIKYKLNNIRDLVGHKVDLAGVHVNPIARMDKADV
ncbi:phenylalanine---tRNA ligase [Synchytrium endobioticum]|uniref:Probable phenylalanine--tRNA ligase alpha subunit n=1 Tax=Synchytrium endobioticum TaxID=286115 RepID=A0A507DJR2_9FUNG|nr:phenylalanine---tRNA ligase [Synchytrium endobioticum]TPX51138.1 phenylalanine---tRNA ligase [Synchytrium endobioticum]